MDRCTPRDKYTRSQVSFPRSVRTSVDDFLLDSPLGTLFSQGGEFFARPRSRSYAYALPKLPDCTWSTSALPSPLLLADPEIDQKPFQERKDNLASWKELAYPTLLSITDPDSALHEVEFDPSCLDALDEQLLRSPTECFSDMCWAAAVEDDIAVPVLHTPKPRSGPRSRTCDYGAVLGGTRVVGRPREGQDRANLDRIKPPREAFSQGLLPSSPASTVTSSSFPKQYSVFAASEQHLLYNNPNESVHYFPVPSDQSMRRRRKKRDIPPVPPLPSDEHTHPQKQPPTYKPNCTLRIISDAYSTLTGRRRGKSGV
ncbi:hypothetical protein PAXINDRAFT_169084 [Paxillus involutus ATCC 200175]|uniref:Uncharacterized protein n=1 Tax=Paxillus involutus ATCC 200175 TaxID=664439 RepID=A0A0C9U8F8_PAXIN|nr:hypothetical protein PAXINDRAFT_169084 [Paxillus involutus ATCC 200175]